MPNIHSLIEVQSFLVAIKRKDDSNSVINKNPPPGPSRNFHHVNWSEAGIEFAFNTRKEIPVKNDQNTIILLSGDAWEWHEAQGQEHMAHASSISLDRPKQACKIINSIIGLPPLFFYEDHNQIIFTSDLLLLLNLKTISLEFFPSSILDLCHVGHTTKYRTLFKNIKMVPGGYSILWEKNKSLTLEKSWQFHEDGGLQYNPDRYIDDQATAFLSAIDYIETEDSFLSLTGGLDTRTIFSALINKKKEIPASYTISGNPLTLDARSAKTLCKHYGIKHDTIFLDGSYLNNIANFATNASLLSGGIHSIEQAHEVFFCEQIGNAFIGRISGNLGNQIGRGGTEGVSMRNADINMISSDYLSSTGVENSLRHWFNEMSSDFNGINYISLLQYEIPHSSVGNYCIGNYYFKQKTPYANSKLIELLKFIPSQNTEELSLLNLRIRDIAHRFRGEHSRKSFQRKLIKTLGGFAAEHPINWGWRASGGTSLRGTIMGLLSMIDILSQKRAANSTIINKIVTLIGAKGLHVYIHPNEWLRNYLKDFVYDTILTHAPPEIIDINTIRSILHKYYTQNDNSHYKNICFALDISIANKLYIKRLF